MLESRRMTRTQVKLNVGCGLCAVPGYLNLDNSATLRLQKWIPSALRDPLRSRLGSKLGPDWPEEVQVWDVTNGLPASAASADVIYSSHMLEHLPHEEAQRF